MNSENKMAKILLSLKKGIVNSLIYKNYYHSKIDENIVYLESRDGTDFTGNILRIAEELSSGNYGNLKLYVYANKNIHPKVKELSKRYNIKIHKILSRDFQATIILEKAKYIITDSGIRHRYVKRPGQIVLNTWHGTPLKYMGKDNVSEEHRVANIQHALLSSDYLLYPNDYMKEKMLNAYMIEKIYPGTILMEGYPRNSVFFDDGRREELKKELDLQNKEIFAYLPTYKGLFTNIKDNEQRDEISEILKELDGKLKDNQVLMVKLHVFNKSKIDFTEFKHIIDFPNYYETYDIVNIADVLITDYSSIFFDFANTERKIVLFNYDEEDYMRYRGTYFPLSDLPFPKVQTVEDLLKELNSPKEYDDGEFIEKFCSYDHPNAANIICRHVFNGEKLSEEIKIKNDKPNILIHGGVLLNNGITSSLMSLLSNIDNEKYNVFLSFTPETPYIEENHEHIFETIDDNVELMPLRNKINPTMLETIDYIRFKVLDNMKMSNRLNNLFERELDRYYPGMPFDNIINYDGYILDEILLFSKAPANTTIWVHNDMIQEMKMKNNRLKNVLKTAYNEYDNVAVVSPDLIEPTSKISGRRDNIKIVHNICNHEKIIEDGEKEIKLDENTYVFSYEENINDVLEKPGKKIITIGRFSKEKGHIRLIKAFDKFANDYPDTQLIIIGGYGPLYEKTEEFVRTIKNHEKVTLIRWISNPMPILKECDLFVLPSFYEGWGMVIIEADTLNIPVMATDIVGTQWMKDYGGYMVENSEDGILNGLYDFMKGNVNTLGLDYEEYNKEAIEEFYSILNSK